ncbi:putative RING zinc finger domain superfamily protein [Zea mays]|uniref:RBR-type E3 ubiquitin transferase n=1 Tax=Zea mays TaxID=4577 RepID=C0P3C8_MAIZE|nr:putative RING zinc finger domain superfamily protein [Zea mays]ACN27494.1 unknown [Zea mays]ONM55018.1 RING/U-box superfamily protein [Zea mays]|eukprot:NP_001168224.1 putative RING zinc finger domain superfamily protein [Zea mays]
MEASATGAADPHFPIYISSDEEDGHAYFIESYSPEEVQIQQTILLSLYTSRAQTAAACSASSSYPTGASSTPKAGTSSTPKETPIDHKRKRKLKLEDDTNDSKMKRSTRNRFNCAICFEMVLAAEKFVVSHCPHAFCNSCIGRYVAGKVADNVAVIGCPDPACETGFIEMDLCRDIIPPELFDRWSVVLCEELLGDDKFYCPFKDCSALLLNDDSAKIRETECPHCHRLFCARCHVPWHDGIECKEFRKLGDDEKGENDLMLKKLADKEKWQRCPKCRMYVSRKSGCLLINCRCKQYFCYHCAAPMDRETHYCENCKH